MPKVEKPKKDASSNTTRELLRGTAFKNSSEYKKELDRIRQEQWEELARAQVQAELLEKEEFKSLQDIWRKPWKGYMKKGSEEIVSFYLSEEGVPSFTIDENLQNVAKGQWFIEGLIKGSFSVFTESYFDFLKINPQNTKSKPNSKK